MAIFLLVWIGLALICALPARGKPIGYGMCVFYALLCPLLGLIIAYLAKDPSPDYDDEMLKITLLKEKGIIDESEYLRRKEKLENTILKGKD